MPKAFTHDSDDRVMDPLNSNGVNGKGISRRREDNRTKNGEDVSFTYLMLDPNKLGLPCVISMVICLVSM